MSTQTDLEAKASAWLADNEIILPGSGSDLVELLADHAAPLEAEVAKLRAAGNEMCILLCLFYKEAAVTMPEAARKDLLAKINAWAATN